MVRFVNETIAAPVAPAAPAASAGLPIRRRDPSGKRPFNLYLNSELVTECAGIAQERYNASVSELVTALLAMERRSKKGLLKGLLIERI